MCGIAGIISKSDSSNIIPNLLSILSNLIARGKDGTGIGYFNRNGRIVIHKKEISAPYFSENFKGEIVDCNIAIGHVRLPTIGAISEFNSHPIMDSYGNIAVVHNGTIRNSHYLKKELREDGHFFKGTVDSEVIPHLIEKYYYKFNDLEKSIQKTIECLEGYYTFSVISNFEPDKVYLYRHHFPLVLVKDEGKTYFSSERKPLSQFLKKRFRARHLKKDELVILER
ncbi:MAG: class II glutamine amidotransferase [Candidatus Helarchaeota archaeon]|nr:class II glutamine amidotransferase [Candidatus Helarchaeota archaeon]